MRPDPALRRAVLVAAVLGQVAAATAGVLPWPVLPATVAATIAGVWIAGKFPGRARLLNRTAHLLVLVAVLALAPKVVAGGPTGIRGSLGLMLVLVQTSQSLAWRTKADLRTGLVCTVGLLVLGASFAPDILVGVPLLAGWAASVRAAALFGYARTGDRTDVTAPGGTVPRTAALTATTLVLGLVAFLIVPVPQDSVLRNTLAAAAAEVQTATRASGPVAFSGPRIDLRTRGELSTRPVAAVPDQSPGLWRSNIYSDYDGQNWTAPAGYRRVRGQIPWVLRTPAAAGRAAQARVTVLGFRSGTVWAPGEPVTVVSADGPAGATADSTGMVRFVPGPGAYDVTSELPVQDPAVLRAATGKDPEDGKWISLPLTITPRVRELATQLTASAPTRYDKVLAIEQWLAANTRYRLDSAVPDPGEDAVDRFLFVDREGFCEQYAAAETVLLRAVGVPARFVTGLAYGTPQDDGTRLYRETDLHAWTEVWYPGSGWSSSDPTAGAQLVPGTAGASFRQRLAARAAAVLRTAQRGPGGKAGLAAELVFAALMAGLVARQSRRWRTVRAARTGIAAGRPVADPGRPGLAAFYRWNDRLGPSGRRPDETLNEMGRRLGPGPSGSLVVVENECYAPTPDPAASDRAATALDRL